MQDQLAEITIWGRRTSANVQKVLWLVDELGLKCRHKPAGGAQRMTPRESLVARNPNGLVPVLEHGQVTVWESNAILRYLVRMESNNRLYGQMPDETAHIDQWLDWQLGTLWPRMLPFFTGMARTPEAQRDHVAVEKARLNTAESFEVLERYLRPDEYVVGTSLTLADIALGPFIHRWFALESNAAGTASKLTRLYERYSTLTLFKRHVLSQSFQSTEEHDGK